MDEAAQVRLLDVPYFHVVFTLPVRTSIKAARGWADNAPSGCQGKSTGVVSEMPMDPI